MHKAIVTACTIACLSAPVLAAKDVVELQPSTSWNIDYGETKCTLQREFGEGELRTTLQLEQTGVGNFFNILIAGEPVGRTRGEFITIQFGPEEIASERSYLSGKLKPEKTPFLIMHGLNLAPVPDDEESPDFVAPDIGTEREEAITKIVVGKALRDDLVLETGSMGAPLAAMRECSQDLVDKLALTEDGQRALESGPEIIDLMRFARKMQQNYPSAMLRNDEEGLVRFRILVDAKGEATSCQIAQSSRPAAFDDIVCFMAMREARFKPARNAEGEPTHAFYETAVRFVLP